MSYAIIRNTKYKRDNLKGIYRHNERRNKNYSNKNINKELSYMNYSLKECKHSYEKEFDILKEKYNLKGQIKVVSNIACEYIITSDKEFFEKIGEKETKRYFETAYNFVSEYKDLGEQYIMSAKVHMDENSPHMHLVFIPVVHTQDKKGNNIDKIACSEFWKEKDSYRRLQDAFYEYMISHNFKLERGLLKEETGREHLDLKQYREITNFDKVKEKIQNMKLELPNVPDLEDINVNRLSKKRDEKILEEIIKPKDELIEKLYNENVNMHLIISRQASTVEKAERYEKERNAILSNNDKLHDEFRNIKQEYEDKAFQLEYKYQNKIHKLEKENKHLNKIIDKFKVTIEKFIHWICKKFDIAEEDNLIRDFQKETNTSLDSTKQIIKEDREEEWDLEL